MTFLSAMRHVYLNNFLGKGAHFGFGRNLRPRFPAWALASNCRTAASRQGEESRFQGKAAAEVRSDYTDGTDNTGDDDDFDFPYGPPQDAPDGPIPNVLQAALNRQLNMHLYSAHLFQLLVSHFEVTRREYQTHACISALHETVVEEICVFLKSRHAAVNFIMPDYDRFCSDLVIHNIGTGREENWVLMDVVRFHTRTCLALRALKCSAQTIRDPRTCVFIKHRLAPLDKNMMALYNHIVIDVPELFSMAKMPDLDPM